MTNNLKNDSFLSKFSNQIERMGRNGVVGILKNTRNVINKPKHHSIRQKVNNISPLENNYNTKGINTYKRDSFLYNNIYSMNNYNKLQSFANNLILEQNPSVFKSQALSIRDNSNNNINYFQNISSNYKSNTFNRRNNTNNDYQRYNTPTYDSSIKNIDDHGYTPYSLKDYKKISNNSFKFGGLGANIGGKEWNLKKNNRTKMNSYGTNVIKNQQGIISKTKGIEEQLESDRKKKLENSKRFKIIDYGYNVRDLRFKKKKDFTLPSNTELQSNEYNFVNNDNYLNQLNQLKKSLII